MLNFLFSIFEQIPVSGGMHLVWHVQRILSSRCTSHLFLLLIFLILYLHFVACRQFFIFMYKNEFGEFLIYRVLSGAVWRRANTVLL